MTPYEVRRDHYSITTDPQKQDLDAIHALLKTTHWAGSMPREVLEVACANSLCFALFENDQLIGFARLITDYCTYAYLTDVVIEESRRGAGLGKWLMEALLAHPALVPMRRVALLTLDAQKYYEALGFTTDTGRLTYMEKRSSDGAYRLH